MWLDRLHTASLGRPGFSPPVSLHLMHSAHMFMKRFYIIDTDFRVWKETGVVCCPCPVPDLTRLPSPGGCWLVWWQRQMWGAGVPTEGLGERRGRGTGVPTKGITGEGAGVLTEGLTGKGAGVLTEGLAGRGRGGGRCLHQGTSRGGGGGDRCPHRRTSVGDWGRGQVSPRKD